VDVGSGFGDCRSRPGRLLEHLQHDPFGVSVRAFISLGRPDAFGDSDAIFGSFVATNFDSTGIYPVFEPALRRW